jgi:hypothetical protein
MTTSIIRAGNKQLRARALSLSTPSGPLSWKPGDPTIFEMELKAPLPRGFLAQRAASYRLVLKHGTSVELEARAFRMGGKLRRHPSGPLCVRVRFYREHAPMVWTMPEKDA